MSIEQITKLLQDIEKDPSAWQRDQAAVMSNYDLTDDERAALRTGDDAALQAMGVDERLSKVAKVRP
ncbi:MAG TPA: hypothetical protein VMR52_14265 [Dehalococcoidia bacterium]|nr:hypothetical protein [Dehalococcoidia bacterium]